MTSQTQISDFLKSKGFEKIQSGNGCTEWLKELESNKTIQINGEGISEITSKNEKVYVGIFNQDDINGKWSYQKVYKNWKDFIENEKNI